jgi:hypothetical protein
VLVALRSERIFGCQERAMHLAWNDATKPEKSAHLDGPLLETLGSVI